jgi:hypothetical protein
MKNNKKPLKKIFKYIATSLWGLFALFGLFMSLLLWLTSNLNPIAVGKYFDLNTDDPTMEYVINFNYGLTGRAAGFSELILRINAGIYRIRTGTSSLSFYDSYFDDPKDQKYIKKGIDYYNRKYSDRL